MNYSKPISTSVDDGAMQIGIEYFPLMLAGDDWSVAFKEKPEIGVIANGQKPSFGEFFSAAKFICCGGLVIEALYVAACVAFDSKTT